MFSTRIAGDGSGADGLPESIGPAGRGRIDCPVAAFDVHHRVDLENLVRGACPALHEVDERDALVFGTELGDIDFTPRRAIIIPGSWVRSPPGPPTNPCSTWVPWFERPAPRTPAGVARRTRSAAARRGNRVNIGATLGLCPCARSRRRRSPTCTGHTKPEGVTGCRRSAKQEDCRCDHYSTLSELRDAQFEGSCIQHWVTDERSFSCGIDALLRCARPASTTQDGGRPCQGAAGAAASVR
jgi:hypothetical protein